MRALFRICGIVSGFLTLPAWSVAEQPPRAIVADFVNTTKERAPGMTRLATDAVAVELNRRGVYRVLAQREMDRAARERGLHAPYNDDDLAALAKELDVDLVVTGEIRQAETRVRDRQREVAVGLVVRVRSIALGEMVNGAAERGTALDPPDGSKTEGVLLMDAVTSAAIRAANRIADYKPIVGTVLNSTGHDIIVLNRGAGYGVRGKQEFVVFRDGGRVGRVKVFKVYSSYTELTVLDAPGGIRPEDKAVAIFPEPTFGRR